MTNPAELLEELEDTISSVAATALRQYVLRDDRRGAIRILKGERFSREQAVALYDYCRKLWGGVDVDLVEIPLTDAVATLTRLDLAAGPDERNKPQYVIRDGRRLCESGAYFERGEWCVFLNGEGFVPLSRIRQLWHVTPKTSVR
jgi:hypothetical protein